MTRPGSGARLFAVYAAVSLVPVVLLGVALGNRVRTEIDDRALAEAVSRAQTIADASIEPVLSHSDIRSGLTAAQRQQLAALAAGLHGDASVIRLRIRSNDGSIVFDPQHPEAPVTPFTDDEVERAAAGHPVRVLTTVGADSIDGGSTTGEQAIETYVAFHDRDNKTVIGVLETYLPYAPFGRAAEASKRRIDELLLAGLAALWGVLAVVSWSVTRRLRRSARHNDWLAHHDVLTRLPNRLAFTEHLKGCSDRGKDFWVSVVDISRFHQVNDTLGHRTADEFLERLSTEMRNVLRPEVLLARLGGDQFGIVVLADDAEIDDVHRRIALAAGSGFPVEGITLTAEVVIGYASSTDPLAGSDEFLRAAELALHAAKQANLSSLRYEPGLDHFDPAQLALASELGAAITAGEMVLHYQPKLDLAGGEVRSVEALVRWQHPTRGLLQPSEFVPIAESTSLITPLTNWVVAEAARQIAEWRQLGQRIRVSVNVSARNLADPELPGTILETLDAAGIPAADLEIEITETFIVSDPVRARAMLTRLHDAGIRISLDDFGQGATSLVSLTTLPLDELKIDRAFVTDMNQSAERRSVVDFVISLGHRLGLTVVAEGIETEAAAAELSAMGCDEGQGYLYSRPIPAAGFVAWLDHHERMIRARREAVDATLEPFARPAAATPSEGASEAR